MTNEKLPVFSYRKCLACGRKTLCFPNSLCRDCILLKHIEQVVRVYLLVSKSNHKALYTRTKRHIRQ